jgi:uncharacterized membrane protein YccC
MTWSRALKETFRSALRVDRPRLEPLLALRAAAGVAIVIGLALLLSTPAVAASSAFGAYAAGTATFQRSWRPRPTLALAVGVAVSVTAFLGYLAAAHWAAFLPLLAVWAFLVGMAWVLGPTAGILASLTMSVMLIVVTLPSSVVGALGHSAVIAFGGVVQAALIVVFPVRRWGPQRDALADAFAAEADYARRLREDPVAPFDPEPLMTARSAAAVTPRQARRRPRELGGKRVLAERIRPVLALLADPEVGAAAEGPERDRARELLGAAASVLDAVARAVRNAAPVRVPEAARAVLVDEPPPEELTGAARRAAVRLTGLLGQAVDSADDPSGPDNPSTGYLPRPTLLALVPVAVRAARREMQWDSPVFRHSLRLAVVAPTGYALGAALPLGHGYWAPMASVLILRPDFSQTYARAVARFAGTLVGVTVATGVMRLATPSAYACGVLAVAAAGLTYFLLRTSYAISQAALSAYVVFLLGMGGSRWEQTVPERVLLTLLGGLLAMLAYIVFPAWETPRLRERLAERIEATGRYAAAALDAYADPGAGKRRRAVREDLLDARATTVAWNQALARADAEPVRRRGLSRREARAADAALTALGRVPMLLEAHFPGPDAPPVPAASAFAAALRDATAAAARAVRERRPPDLSPVRDALAAWPPPPAESSARDRVARRTAELLVDALDDLEAALRRRR